MKLKIMAQTFLAFCGILSLKELPINGETKSLNLDAAQRQKIVDALGEDLARKAIDGINSEIKNMAQENLNLKAIQDEIDALVAEGVSKEQLENLAKDAQGNVDTVAALKLAQENQSAVTAKNKEMAEMIAKLIQDPEGDKPFQVIRGGKMDKAVHSATHLFGSNNDYDAYDEGRNWNRRAAGLTTTATDFASQPAVQKLNDDMNLFFRQNPESIKSLQRDTFGLPDFWQKRTKVDDKVADGFIATAEISQGRKLSWLPKNKQTIQAEEGQIFPVQIDIEFVGHYLQKIEASWLNFMNKEGSQPYKESFVRFLVSELDKKARVEDRVATIKGIYVPTPDGATVAGRSINRQNGLLYLIQQAREVTKKYRAFDIGMPTTSNIVDYVDGLIKALPQDVREQQGLVLYLSTEWLRSYKRRYETLYGLNEDYAGYPDTPKDFPNVKFERLVDMAGSDFMFITFDDNIEILENVPAEKSMYHFEYLKRMIYIWADYKLGIRLIHIGTTVAVGDPLEFSVQTVWSNTAPIFPADFYVPVNDDETGIVKAIYKNLNVSKDWKTTITKFTGTTPGTILKVKGDTTLVNESKIKSNANNSLTADFNLKLGGTLTLFVNADGTVKELGRTTAPDTTVIPDATFDAASVDANGGISFFYTGATTKAITSIVNGVEGKSIKIYGTDAVGIDVTLSDIGNINVVSAVILGDSNDFVQLTKVDGVWIETERSITA